MAAPSTSRRAFVDKLSSDKAVRDKQLAKFIKLHLRPGRANIIDVTYTPELIKSVLDATLEVLKSQETLVQIDSPFKVVGDLHGQYTDLKRIMAAEGYPPDTKYVFLGDYVDRGRNSLECVMLLFAYKTLYRNSVILLRGNHECRELNRSYGFYDELNRRQLAEVYNDVNNVFDHLPLAALISKKILCMHGGISKYINNLEQIRKLQRPINTELPNTPDIVHDLMWADPDKTVKGFVPSERGISNVFGMDALEKFCVTVNIDLVVRGHQVVKEGFERMGGTRTRLVTIFSAPNYCNDGDNSAGVMRISETMQIHFSVLQPCADMTYLAERQQARLLTPKVDQYPARKT